MHLSIVIPTRLEPANLWFTLQGLLQLLERIPKRFQWEIIVADNQPEPVKGRAISVSEKVVGDLNDTRVRYLPCPEKKSPYHPRNRGAVVAKGEWLLFLDSHVLMAPNFFDRVLEQTNGSNGYPVNAIVHYPVVFNTRARTWGPYALRVNTDFWGTWKQCSLPAGLHPIAGTGIWAMCMTRSWYLNGLHGFNENFLGYSGGEPYLDLKSWCMGGRVLFDTTTFGSHYSAPRAYAASMDDRIRNFALAIAVLDQARLTTFQNYYVAEKGLDPKKVGYLIQQGQELAESEAEWFSHQRRYKLNEVLNHFRTEGIQH